MATLEVYTFFFQVINLVKYVLQLKSNILILRGNFEPLNMFNST